MSDFIWQKVSDGVYRKITTEVFYAELEKKFPAWNPLIHIFLSEMVLVKKIKKGTDDYEFYQFYNSITVRKNCERIVLINQNDLSQYLMAL
jgi:hypothetical protein